MYKCISLVKDVIILDPVVKGAGKRTKVLGNYVMVLDLIGKT